jgi:hypothetical protein
MDVHAAAALRERGEAWTRGGLPLEPADGRGA